MTNSSERDDTSSVAQNVDYTTDKPTVDLDKDSTPLTDSDVHPRDHRDAIKYYHSAGSSRTKVSVLVDSEIINRKARSEELNSKLDDKD